MSAVPRFDASSFDPADTFFITVDANSRSDGRCDANGEEIHAFGTEKDATSYALEQLEEYGCETAIFRAQPIKVIRRAAKVIRTDKG